MSRIPDYDKMRDMLAEYETECAEGDTIYDIIRYGNMGGWEAMTDEEVLESFVEYFDSYKIPKKPLTEDEMNQMALKNEDQRIERGDDNPISIHMFRDQMMEDD